MKKVRLQAHRGVSTDFPENTMSAFWGAVEQGYDVIELDPAVTKDKQFIILHDHTLNRTGRFADGTPLPEQKKIADTNLEELAAYEFGSWFSSAFAGEKLPRLEDVLKLSEKAGIPLKIDNKFEHFAEPDLTAFLNILEDSHAHLAFTCARAGNLLMLAERFPEAELHYDGAIDEETLALLSGSVGPDRLTVWVPYKNKDTSWVTVEFLNEDLAQKIKQYAALGVWILSTEEEYQKAVALGADIIETTGSLKPRKGVEK